MFGECSNRLSDAGIVVAVGRSPGISVEVGSRTSLASLDLILLQDKMSGVSTQFCGDCNNLRALGEPNRTARKTA